MFGRREEPGAARREAPDANRPRRVIPGITPASFMSVQNNTARSGEKPSPGRFAIMKVVLTAILSGSVTIRRRILHNGN
jgi:hypothetical protein